MSAISAKAIDALKVVQNKIKLPTKGDTITVLRGRNKGKSGVVFYANPNGVSHFGGRYGSATENCIADACGASLRLGIQPTEGEKFFVNYFDHVK